MTDIITIDSFLDDVEQRVARDIYDFVNCPTVKDRLGPYHKQDVVAAILKHGGLISGAARELSRSRSGFDRYIKTNRDVFEYWSDIRESNIDILERNVMREALGGDLGACLFLLKTIGKGRGYSSRQEHTGKDEGPIEVKGAAKESLLSKLGVIQKKVGE